MSKQIKKWLSDDCHQGSYCVIYKYQQVIRTFLLEPCGCGEYGPMFCQRSVLKDRMKVVHASSKKLNATIVDIDFI